MSWTFSHWTRSELIHKLTQPDESEAVRYETIAHTLRGNVLWSVVRITAKQPDALGLDIGQSIMFIACYLLQGSGSGWGYKSMDESMHPFYYSCPQGYLSMAPEQSREWRKGVRAYHARRRTQIAPAKTMRT
ncbi:hypothetical protein [Sodalis sp. RH22]|uniref:hypothetical protein n=1 Tax=unclassified Sodalis (in: enterobacteria) TaxID=2636512 RepID=UPI0039B4B1D9